MEKFEEKIEQKKEKEAEIQPPEFEIKDFENSRKSFENLIKQLSPAIRNHEYNLLVGDDVSGRIPALILGGVMKDIYKREKIESPQILFFGGDKRPISDSSKLSNYFRNLIDKKKINPENIKALLITDNIETGRTIDYFTEALSEVGLSCDIAAVSSDISTDEISRRWSGFQKRKACIGNFGEGIYFYGKKDLGGVEKNTGEIFSKRLLGDRDKTIKARRDVGKMVAYLKQIYDQEKEKLEKQEQN